jgi:hypothetical protein
MSEIDWSHLTFTEHMTEAAAVVGTCQVVLDFGEGARVAYEIQVLRHLKGGDGQPFFALGRRQDGDATYRPLGEGPTPEAALQDCLSRAGVHHRRLVKQAAD